MGDESSASVSHVAVKVVPFYRKNPEIWFTQLEAQFALAKVTCAKTQYFHALTALPEDVASKLTVSASTDYNSLKEQVLDSLKANKHLLIEQALSAVDLGDRRPTELVSEIKKRFQDINLTPDDTIIKSRLLSALPCHIRSALVGHDSASLDDYARIADSMLAVAQTPSGGFHVGAVSSYDQHKQQGSHSQHYSSRVPPVQNQKNYTVRSFYPNQRPRVCNSHIFYGNRARHCRPWCQWPNKPASVLADSQKTPRNSRPSSPSN